MKIEKQLLVQCLNGERQAQYRLYKACFPILISICSRYKKSDQESVEMMNIGFYKILKNLNQYSFNTPFEAWIRRIMINCMIDDYRKNRKAKEIIEYRDLNGHDYLDMDFDYNLADQEFDADELRTMIRKLPNKTLQVFNLYAIDGYTHKEIAGLLKMSANTSKWHLAEARKKLQKMVKEHLSQIKIVKHGQ